MITTHSKAVWLLVLCQAGALLPVQAENTTGSIWPYEDGVATSFFADRTANRVGDLITIVINLSTTASKNSSTDTSKKSSANDTLTALLYPQSDGPYDWYRYRDPNSPQTSFAPTMQWSADQKFTGGGKIANAETLVTTIEARIVDISPNGVMQLEAHRNYEIGEEKTEIVMTGFVRREDVSANNTVESIRVADLQIKQNGTGPVSRSQRKGWLNKLYDLFNPF